jgi:DNA-binding GntR family transcriptional regulator
MEGTTGTTPSDVHYNRLKADLLAGRYPPGTTLYETALSSVYRGSRTPMREAVGPDTRPAAVTCGFTPARLTA